MSVCRVRLARDFPETGRFEWMLVDERSSSVLETGTSDLAMPPGGKSCEAVLAAELVLLERVSVPPAQQRRVQAALRFLAEDSLVPDPARVHVAAAGAPQKDVMCVGIVDREWLAQALGRLERAGMRALAAYPESLLPPLEPHAWIVVCGGADGFVRTGEAEGFALDSVGEGEPPVALRLAIDGARSAGRLPERVVLRALSDAELPEPAQWSAALGVPVERGDPWRWTQARHRPPLELLQGEFAPRRAGGGWRGNLRRPALLAAVLLAVGSAGIAADWALKSAERERLQAEMRAIYRETFGEGAVLVDPPLQMSRALADLRLRSGQGSAADFVSLLGSVAERIPISSPGQRVESIEYQDGRLALSLRARDPRQSEALAAQLRTKASAPGLELRVDQGDAGVVRLTASAPGSR
jgi:general secretion pathway protein L